MFYTCPEVTLPELSVLEYLSNIMNWIQHYPSLEGTFEQFRLGVPQEELQYAPFQSM